MKILKCGFCGSLPFVMVDSRLMYILESLEYMFDFGNTIL